MAALRALDVCPTLAPCGLPHGSLVDHAGTLAEALAVWLPDTDLLITHAYEGGHRTTMLARWRRSWPARERERDPAELLFTGTDPVREDRWRAAAACVLGS